jgi:hypothetical protein
MVFKKFKKPPNTNPKLMLEKKKEKKRKKTLFLKFKKHGAQNQEIASSLAKKNLPHANGIDLMLMEYSLKQGVS